ncbi:MAG: hypothetical protein LBR51_04075 [Bacteroidales bacterium]|jgi:hypothetical protein|nr:hypothetical protein [Bacteroidales bacterium]
MENGEWRMENGENPLFPYCVDSWSVGQLDSFVVLRVFLTSSTRHPRGFSPKILVKESGDELVLWG